MTAFADNGVKLTVVEPSPSDKAKGPHVTDLQQKGGLWNQHPFQCPDCGTHFKAVAVRIRKFESSWLCARCYDQRDAIWRQRATVTNLDDRRTPDQRLDTATCAHCHKRIGAFRRTVNPQGELIHQRCPGRRRPRT